MGERLTGVGVGGNVDVGWGVSVRLGIGVKVGVQLGGSVMTIAVGVSDGREAKAGIVGGGNGFREL